MRPTPRKRYRLIGAALLLIFGFLAAWRAFVLLTPPPERQTVRLEDGTVVEMLGYSFGKKHALTQREPITGLLDLLRIHQPPTILRSAETDRDALLLWVRIPHRLELHPGNAFLAYARGVDGYTYPSSVVNYTAVKYHVGNPYDTFHMVRGANGALTLQGEEILAIPITCYPRREARFPVDLARYGEKQPLATFHIANQNTVRATPFTPPRLPAIREEHDLKVTLESITPESKQHYVQPNGYSLWRSEKDAPRDAVPLLGEEGRQHLTLTYTDRGRPAPHWNISELTASDGMGNRTQEIAPAPGWPCRDYYPPSVGQPYKLTLGIQKTWGNHYDSDELWTVKDILLPERGKPVAINSDFRRDDLHLRLVRVYGMGGKNFSTDLALVQIKVETTLKNPVLLVHAEDELGRTVAGPWAEVNNMYAPGCTDVQIGNITIMHTGFIGDNNPQYRTVPLKIPKGVKRLKLVITAPRTHFFEFVAPPYRHAQR